MVLKFLFLSILSISFLWASIAGASTLSVDESELVSNSKWSISTPFKEENKKEDEKEFSGTLSDENDRRNEWKEDEHHVNFDRGDRHYRTKECEKPSPVPIPGTLTLFLSGLAGLIGFVRHKKNTTK